MFCWFGPRVCKNWYLCVTLIMLFSSKYFTKVTLWDHEKKTFSSNLVDTRSLKMIGHGIRDNYNINSSSWLFTGFGVCMMPQKCDFYIEKNTGPHKVLIFWNSLAILHKVIFNLGSKLKGGIMVSLAYWTSLYSSIQILACAVCFLLAKIKTVKTVLCFLLESIYYLSVSLYCNSRTGNKGRNCTRNVKCISK